MSESTPTVNIVSTAPFLIRLLTLEVIRMGLVGTVSDLPQAGHQVYLVDTDTCKVLPKEGVTLLIGNEKTGLRHLTKPFLLTDLRRLLWECLAFTPQPQPSMHTGQSPSRLVIHETSRSASVDGGDPISLSNIEYRLLCRMQALGHEPLGPAGAKDILGETDSNKLSVYICLLRRKLERGELRLIETVRGKGYRLKSL